MGQLGRMSNGKSFQTTYQNHNSIIYDKFSIFNAFSSIKQMPSWLSNRKTTGLPGNDETLKIDNYYGY